MKNRIKYTAICIALLLSLSSCEKDELKVNEDLGKQQYILPKGEPGTVDARIYDIHEKYGTYIFYEFEKKDMSYLWNGAWNRWYSPANLSDNKKYVSHMIDLIERVVINKFEPEFVRRTLPYKIYLVDSLSKDYNQPTSASNYLNMASNGQSAFAISNVGLKSDTYSDADWKALETELNGLYTQNYFAALTVKPVDFMASKRPTLTGTMEDDPTGEDIRYNHSVWTDGLINGRKMTFLTPEDDQDYADFVAFLTGTSGTEIQRRLKKYEKLKIRTLLLIPYLYNVVELNVIGTQNNNFPDDKLPADYFEKLQ